jgi:glycosyltransferase involved in cell wall biosynthesis
MWDRIRNKHPEVFLIMYGKGIEFSSLGMHNSYALRIGDFIANIDWDRRIALLQPAFKEYVSHMDMAMLYRSCDVYLLNSRSEGFGYPVIEAMACGAVCVVPNYGSTKEFIREKNCLPFEGRPIQADYSDKGFHNVGNWWEPDLTDLCLKVEQAISLDANAAAEIGCQARQFILSNFTWRHSMVALRKKLELLQTQPLYKPVSAKRLSPDRYRKQMASLMASVGSNLVKASIVMEHRGLPGLAIKVKSRLLKYCQKKFRKFEN